MAEQESIAIAGKFLAKAPAGEWAEVEKDVRALHGDDGTYAENLPAFARGYNKENVVGIAVEGSKKKAPICEASEVDGSHIFDPHSLQILEIDHTKLEVVSARPAEDSDRCAAGEDFRLSAQKHLSSYTEEHFHDPTFGAFAREEGGNVVVTTVIAGSRVSPKNFVSGRWRSVFQFTIHGTSAQVSGGVNVLVHYYEDGNVQLRATKDFQGQIDFSSPEDFGKAVAKFLETNENKYAGNLSGEYTSLQEGAFKNLRKKIPFIQQRFQWQNVSRYSLARELARDK